MRLILYLFQIGFFYGCSTIQNKKVLPVFPVADTSETVLDRKEMILPTPVSVPFVERRDTAYTPRFITIDDSVKLYVIEEGKGTPIVLLNGGPGNSLHSFIPWFSRAAEFSRLIYYDPRGVGKSDWKPGAGYSTLQAVEDLEKLRQKLAIGKWVVAGWSWGGLLAQHYSLKYPGHVKEWY